MNGSEAATKADLQVLEQKIDEKIDHLRSETNHQYNKIVERIDDLKTELLKVFYQFEQSNIVEVEHRPNMPPAA